MWIRWDHSTSRAQQPQLHSHVTVLNRAETNSDGMIRALASPRFKPIKQAADAIYTKALNETLAASNGVVFATRPDGTGFSATGRDHAEQNTHADEDPDRLYEAVFDAIAWARGEFDNPPPAE